MRESEAMKLVGKLAAAYPHAKLGEGVAMSETLQVYAEMLADLDFADAERAVVEIIAESRFFPTIAEIRERVASERVALPPAELAWADVLAAVRKVGVYRTPVFDNPCTAIAVSNVGWRAICNSETPGVERAHFIRAYERALQLAKREENAERLLEHVDQARLTGIHDATAGDDERGPGTIAGAVLRALPEPKR